MTKEEKKAKERHDKELFVETKLYPLLDAINHSILYAEFVVDDGDEFVEITYSTPLSARKLMLLVLKQSRTAFLSWISQDTVTRKFRLSATTRTALRLSQMRLELMSQIFHISTDVLLGLVKSEM